MFLKLVLLVSSCSGLQRDSQGLPRSGNTVRDDPLSRCGGDGPGISGNTLQNGDHCQNSHTGSQSRKPIPGTDTEGTPKFRSSDGCPISYPGGIFPTR